jgi:SAM-dependent methyltransferase
VAANRAASEGITARTGVVAGAASALPFRAGSFDAVIHTDVLCWLRAKLSVLRACRRLLRPGGRIGFYSIVESPGLSAAARRRARAAGPRAVAMRSDHRRLLRAAGFGDITESDVTAAFAATAAAWLAETEPYTAELSRLEPPGTFAQRQADRRRMLAAIHAGLLRRVLVLAQSRWTSPPAGIDATAHAREVGRRHQRV